MDAVAEAGPAVTKLKIGDRMVVPFEKSSAKAIHAAGRVIRTPQDKGCIHLMDDRFGRPDV